MLPYLSMKEDSLFCFVIMISPKPWCLRLCYGTCHQKFLNEYKGATTWFRMFGVTVWNLLIIEPLFHWIFWKSKIENYIGTWGLLVLLESPHQVQFNKVDFVILSPKMWTILLIFGGYILLLEIQTNCKKRFGRKIHLNAFKLGPMT
jgi:hypothetical protein